MIKLSVNEDLKRKHIVEVAPKIKKYINKERTTSNKKCLDYIEANISYIIGADSYEVDAIVEKFQNDFPNSLDDTKILYKTLKNKIFGYAYNNWRRWKYNPYVFVEETGLKTCPYCNRNYIFSVNNRSKKLRPEIDHFYPKSKYPFLAMSYGNLIPSCSVCNHTKSDTYNKSLVNPYSVKENDYYITLKPNSIDFALVEVEKYDFKSFDIEVRGKAIINIDIFKLKELYSQHKDEVLELLVKKAYYPKSYIRELELFDFSKDEIYRYLFSNYNQDDDLHKRPLSKLIKDISQELGLL